MKRYSDKAHPLVLVAQRHKTGMNMRAESIDVILTTQFKSDIISTIKFDGEHNVIHWKQGDDDCTLCTSGGSVRIGTTPGKELASILNKLAYDEVIFAGELYAVWDDGRRMMLNDVIHHVQAPSNAQEEARQRIALFDIITINGDHIFDDYWKKIVLMNEIVGSGKTVHVVTAKQGSPDIAKEMWEHDVIGKNMEGLVLHSGGGVIKVKMIHNMDLVVIGMKLTGARLAKGLATSFLVAFMAPDGRFVVSSHVGAAAVMAEQKEWYDWIYANNRGEMVVDGERHIMCEPKRIIEIGANDWYVYEEAELTALKYENNQWSSAGRLPGAKGQKPRIVKVDGKIHERKDKGVNPTDLRLTQVPDFKAEWIEKFCNQTALPITDKPSTDDWNTSALAAIFGDTSFTPKKIEQKKEDIIKSLFDNPRNIYRQIEKDIRAHESRDFLYDQEQKRRKESLESGICPDCKERNLNEPDYHEDYVTYYCYNCGEGKTVKRNPIQNPYTFQGKVEWAGAVKDTEYGRKFYIGVKLDTGEVLKAAIAMISGRKVPDKGDIVKFTTHRQPKNGWASVTENQTFEIISQSAKIKLGGTNKVLWTSSVKGKRGLLFFYVGIETDSGEQKLVVEFPYDSEDYESWYFELSAKGGDPSKWVKDKKPWRGEWAKWSTLSSGKEEWLKVDGLSEETWLPIQDPGLRHEFIASKKKEEADKKAHLAQMKAEVEKKEAARFGEKYIPMFGGATKVERVREILILLAKRSQEAEWMSMGYGGKTGVGPGTGFRAPGKPFWGLPAPQRDSIIKRMIQFGLIEEMKHEQDRKRKFKITHEGRVALDAYLV